MRVGEDSIFSKISFDFLFSAKWGWLDLAAFCFCDLRLP